MSLSRRKFLHIATGAAAAVSLSRTAWAQTYPTRSVRVIVPYAPGGQTDAIGRIFAQQLSDRLGQQFYVENVPGAGGNIGVARAAQAAPDGYTVLVTDGLSLAVNPTLYGSLPYDPFKDLQPVALAEELPVGGAPIPALAYGWRDLVAAVRTGGRAVRRLADDGASPL